MALRATAHAWVDYRHGSIEPTTAANQRAEIDAFAAFVGPDRTIESITIDDVQGWIRHLRTTPAPRARNGFYSDATVRFKANIVKAFLDWCCERDIIQWNPAQRVDLPRRPPPRPQALDRYQAEAVIDAAGGLRDRTIVKWMLLSGWRPSEIARMRVEHWNRANQTIWVRRSKSKMEQQFWVVGDLEDALAPWVDYGLYGVTSGPMWPSSRTGEAIKKDAIGDVWRKACKAAGYDFQPKQARHTFGTSVARAGHRTSVVADLMGHLDPSSSLQYTAADDAETYLALSNNPVTIGEKTGGPNDPPRLRSGPHRERAHPEPWGDGEGVRRFG